MILTFVLPWPTDIVLDADAFPIGGPFTMNAGTASAPGTITDVVADSEARTTTLTVELDDETTPEAITEAFGGTA